MPSTHKKVIVRKMDRDTVNGYVAPANFVREGKLELLNTAGTVIRDRIARHQGRVFRARVWRIRHSEPQDFYQPAAHRGPFGFG